MNNAQRQIVAEEIASTVRVLELLGFEYEISAPKNRREKGNKSPRVVYVNVGEKHPLRVYNSINGHTWANQQNGEPIKGVRSIEDLYNLLSDNYG